MYNYNTDSKKTHLKEYHVSRQGGERGFSTVNTGFPLCNLLMARCFWTSELDQDSASLMHTSAFFLSCIRNVSNNCHLEKIWKRGRNFFHWLYFPNFVCIKHLPVTSLTLHSSLMEKTLLPHFIAEAERC